MTHNFKYYYKTITENFTVKKPWDTIIIFVLNILIAIPIFIIIHQNLIQFNWYLHLDRVLIFIVLIIVIQLILQALRRIILIGVFIYLIALLFGTLFGKYNFETVSEDYQTMMYAMAYNPYPQDIIVDKLLPFPNKSKIISAIDYENPKVRDFAIMAVNKYFKDEKRYHEYSTLIQCFAVFKEINNNWNYVSDPKGKEYIASASESVRYLSGDCDDHSILMAAAVKSIGGTPRLIHTDGHIYPEILIGKRADMETMNYLIKKVLFPKESNGKTIHYHIDERGNVWLNLDYTAKYPGGPFMKEEVLSALTLD
ncbi:MAG: transglutaminase [Flavobacterium sp.]